MKGKKLKERQGGGRREIYVPENPKKDSPVFLLLKKSKRGRIKIKKAAVNFWNYFPHKTLGGLSPAEKILEYEKEEKKTKGKMAIKSEKLTKKQFDLLWSGGGKGPYSQVNLIRQVRILDTSVSRVFIVVETEINPTTFEIVKKDRRDEEFKSDIAIQQLLDTAEYRGPQLGYVTAAFEKEYKNDEVLVQAEQALKYTQESIIKMHRYVCVNI